LEERWGISNDDYGQSLREASFINDDNWENWKICSGTQPSITAALRKPSEIGRALIKAITERQCQLYQHWYDTLSLGETLGMEPQKL
jgi:hypothetical protein